MDLSVQAYILLFGAALLAGFVDAIAGGGGIITIPMLLTVGLPPHLALGTNKLQASFGSFTATLNYRRGGLVQGPALLWGILCTAIGAGVGAIAIQAISANLLQQAIPVVLIAVFVYVLIHPDLGTASRPQKFTPWIFYLLFGLLIGFYDGFFGPGTGSFWTLAFVLCLGLDLKRATGHTKVLNFTSNIVALLGFALGGNVVCSIGILMGIGQVMGATLGSHLVLKRSTRFVRVFFLIVVALTIVKLLFTQ
ncbi:TSUP family transporter [Planctomycetota bacterium]